MTLHIQAFLNVYCHIFLQILLVDYQMAHPFGFAAVHQNEHEAERLRLGHYF